MIRASLCLIAFSVLFVSLHQRQEVDLTDQYKKEVETAEHEFAEFARTHSVREAFLKFAAPEAVLKRGGKLVQGPKEIEKYFDQSTLKDLRLSWKPDFVDASKSGDLGYTYGKFTLTAKDAEGNEISDDGIFHTVWKRQRDGQWKFVWD